ncbi:hypothetical protein XFF6166_670119 [Xanthomonas citri pv. fuscans]|nr:hypothetical protein XFF6166_670119 [Xanthomonas citri pv. fuscans]SOO04235.1 hypothetical protein XFF7767_240076 [Xanthomonas citri pv. fuscans]SOO08379.1 hypothetical protein XFF6970_210033 [Xanthomonas citri pv. fuscans]SOO16657.1 hypothetical protein XFF7766_850076 [Xanthomonas citri pv. fuscans]SOO43835.1 hypothetical protein XFF1815_400076 [Xanthomonas citri pv. fuscans]
MIGDSGLVDGKSRASADRVQSGSMSTPVAPVRSPFANPDSPIPNPESLILCAAPSISLRPPPAPARAASSTPPWHATRRSPCRSRSPRARRGRANAMPSTTISSPPTSSRA